MPTIVYPPTRPLSVGEVLDLAFRIFGVTLLRCLPYAVLAMIVGQLQSIYDIVTRQPLRQFGGGDPAWWALYALGAFLAAGCFNVILLRQHAIASRVPVPGIVAGGMFRAPAATAVFILILLATAVCLVPALALPKALQPWGLLLLSIPASYAGIAFSCAWPALLIGPRTIIGSLRHSLYLVRGNFWRISTIYLVAMAMLGVLFVSAGIVVGVLMQFVAGGDLAVATAVSTVMVAVMGALYVPFLTATGLAVYVDLEARREGRDLERRIAGAVS